MAVLAYAAEVSTVFTLLLMLPAFQTVTIRRPYAVAALLGGCRWRGRQDPVPARPGGSRQPLRAAGLGRPGLARSA